MNKHEQATRADLPNPYSPPSETTEGAETTHFTAKPTTVSGLIVGWIVVFGLNLITPVLFATAITNRRGMIGVGIACVAFAVAGTQLCVTRRETGKRLVTGASIVGLSQLFPIAQVFAGVFAINLASAVGIAGETLGGGSGITSISAGFVVCLLTGIPLAVLAWIIGTLLFLVAGQRNK
jgi:hypothetical protein